MTALVIALLLAGLPTTGQQVVTDTVRLRHVQPAVLAQQLKLSPDLEQITFDFKSKAITVRGPRTAVMSTMEQIFEVDRKPVVYRVELRVMRRVVDSNGRATETLHASPWASASPRLPVTFHTSGDEARQHTVAITIVQTAAGARIEASLRIRDQAGNELFASTKERNVKLGELVQLGGMTEARDASLRRVIEGGDRPVKRGEYTAYYLAVRLSVLAGDPMPSGR